MSVEYKFEDANDYFLLEVNSLVEQCLVDSILRKKQIKILEINKKSLEDVKNSSQYAFAQNLIGKIDYLLELEKGE